MSKKSKSASQFPKIYRLITENSFYLKLVKLWNRLPNQSKRILSYVIVFNFIVITTIFVVISILLAKNLSDNAFSLNKTYLQRRDLQSQINFWKSVLDKYPGYKDAYFKIAVLYYELNDFDNARLNNNKAILLDPNYEDARKLEALIK